MRERPSSKSEAFGRGLDRNALLEQSDGLLHLALAQTLGSQFPQFARSLSVICDRRSYRCHFSPRQARLLERFRGSTLIATVRSGRMSVGLYISPIPRALIGAKIS